MPLLGLPGSSLCEVRGSPLEGIPLGCAAVVREVRGWVFYADIAVRRNSEETDRFVF